MMIAQGVRLPESPRQAYEPIWCAWGYRRQFEPSQIYGALPIVKQLGFGWVTLDDGWQTAEGDWFLDKTKFPNGDGDMKSMVDRIHQDGFKAQLWWSPMSVDPGTELIKQHPEWLVLDVDGSRHKISYWDAFYLCPAIPKHNAHSPETITIHYPFHPLHGQNLRVHRRAKMPQGEYIYCELSDGTLGGLPAWMADPARVPSFTRGAPMTSAEALAELQSLLDSLRPTVNRDMPTRKEARSNDSKQAGKGAEIGQMNLPLIESKPVMLPSDKQRELASALADLLLAVAIQFAKPDGGDQE